MKNTRNCRLALSCILGTALLCACNMPLVTPEMVTAAKDSFGMSATVANKQVVLDWVPDPTVESYNLRFTRNGSMPSPANGEILSDVKPPLTVAGLANGNLHLFTVTATFPGGQTKEIGLVRAIPLSAATLAPQVKGQIGQIRVRWPKIAATDSFLVERRSGETGAFVNLGVVSGCEYIDRDVAEGLDYYYRIKPSAYADMASGANVARPAMALKSAYLSQALSSTDRSLDIGASGNFAYVAEGTKGFRALDIRDPANPIPLATYALPANPRLTEVTELAVSGSWLCLVGYGDLAVYKLNTGTGAATFDRFVTVAKPYAAASDQAARAVVIKGNFAYVACDSQGVQVVNLDTGAIVQYLDFGLNASVFDVAVFKDAYLAVQTYSYVGPANPSNSAVIKVYSIAANGSLVGLGASATKNLGVLNPSAHLAVAGDFLYVLAYQKWVTLSLAAPAAPVLLSTKDFAPAAMGVDLVGNRCIIFGERYGPQSAMAYEYDVADPANPVLSTSYELPYGGWAAAILDSAILVAADATGVQVVRDPRRFAAKKSFLRLAGNGELTVFDVETRGGLVALVGQSGSGGAFRPRRHLGFLEPTGIGARGFPGHHEKPRSFGFHRVPRRRDRGPSRRRHIQSRRAEGAPRRGCRGEGFGCRGPWRHGLRDQRHFPPPHGRHQRSRRRLPRPGNDPPPRQELQHHRAGWIHGPYVRGDELFEPPVRRSPQTLGRRGQHSLDNLECRHRWGLRVLAGRRDERGGAAG